MMRTLLVVRRAIQVGALQTGAFLMGAATLLVSTSAVSQVATGDKNFNTYCVACHTIGGGIRVGPDLKGVTDRYPEEWLLRFIKSSQAMIQSGDPRAVARFAEFNKVVMPDAPYSEDAIKEILAYIKSDPSPPAVAPTRPATPDDVFRGQELFQGHLRFLNGGPPCNSCHHVKNDAVIGGGVLAKELTSVFASMGAPGIQAILGKPPFPVMDEAYRDRPLTDDEVFAMVGFLQDADQHQAFQQPRDYGFRLFYSGAGVFVVLMGLCALFGRRRKQYPVNHQIFERQVRTH